MKVPKELKATGRMSAWKVLTQSSLLISRRDHQHHLRDHQRRQIGQEQRVAADEAQPGEGVGGEAGDGQHDHGDGAGNQRAVQEEAAEGQVDPGVEEVAPLPVAGQQPRRHGQHLAIRPDGVGQHPEEREQEGQRHQRHRALRDQRAGSDGAGVLAPSRHNAPISAAAGTGTPSAP
jgi:hypothetical protein